MEAADPLALVREYRYYDPIYMLPADGQQWWRSQVSEPERVSPVLA